MSEYGEGHMVDYQREYAHADHDDCDSHSRCTPVDELLPGEDLLQQLRDEVAELEQTLAAKRAENTRLRELVKAAVWFEFSDGSDCYHRELRDGSTVWNARLCVSGDRAQSLKNKDDALIAIGKGHLVEP